METGLFERRRSAVAAPSWLRDLGVSAWLLIGVALVVLAVFWALAAASTIVGPVVVGVVVATVASPLVARMQRHGIGRAWGSLIVLLCLVAVSVAIALLVVVGISGQMDTITSDAGAAADRLQAWLQDAGVGTGSAQTVRDHVASAAPTLVAGLATGFVAGVRGVASIALGVSFTAFAVFFLLKDGPHLRRTLERHLGLPVPVAQVVVRNVIRSVRGYFLGVTIVAAFNAVVTLVGALLLGVPLPGTIALVTFVTAYVPFVGAFAAGTFAVLLALSQGTLTAVAMLVVFILANGLLQNLVSPFAMGAALDINPLLSLVVTISAGCLLGMFGLVLAAPLTAAALHIGNDLRAAEEPSEMASVPSARAVPT